VLQGRPADALEPLVRLADLAGNDAERAELAIVHIDTLWVYLGRPLDGLRVAAAAEASITDPALRADVAARRTGLALTADGPGPSGGPRPVPTGPDRRQQRGTRLLPLAPGPRGARARPCARGGPVRPRGGHPAAPAGPGGVRAQPAVHVGHRAGPGRGLPKRQ